MGNGVGFIIISYGPYCGLQENLKIKQPTQGIPVLAVDHEIFKIDFLVRPQQLSIYRLKVSFIGFKKAKFTCCESADLFAVCLGRHA